MTLKPTLASLGDKFYLMSYTATIRGILSAHQHLCAQRTASQSCNSSTGPRCTVRTWTLPLHRVVLSVQSYSRLDLIWGI